MANHQILEDNLRPMQTPEETMKELEEMLNNEAQASESQPTEENAVEQKVVVQAVESVEEKQEDKTKKIAEEFEHRGLRSSDAIELANNFNNPDKFRFGLVLSAKSALRLNNVMAKLGITHSICALYDKILIALFMQNGKIDLESPKAFSSDQIVDFAEACQKAGFSPLDSDYVKGSLDIATQTIRPVILLAGFEKVVFGRKDFLKVKYEFSQDKESMFLPVDPISTEDDLGFCDAFWSNEKSLIPTYVKCTLTFAKDFNGQIVESEIEGYAFSHSDVCLSTYWARYPLLMLQHVAFKRASKMLLKDTNVLLEMPCEQHVKSKMNSFYKQACNAIKSATIDNFAVVKARIASNKAEYGELYEGLVALIAQRYKEITVNLGERNKKSNAVNPNISKPKSPSYIMPTNKTIPPESCEVDLATYEAVLRDY